MWDAIRCAAHKSGAHVRRKMQDWELAEAEEEDGGGEEQVVVRSLYGQ